MDEYYSQALAAEDSEGYFDLLEKSAERMNPKAIRRLIGEYSRSEDREKRFRADRWILSGYGMGMVGFEIQTAQMLFEGKGVYSGENLGFVNRKRAAEILLQLDDGVPGKAFLLGKILLTAEELPDDDELISEEFLPSYPEQGIGWLLKSQCPQGYAEIGKYYEKIGSKEEALQYYRAAFDASCGSQYGDDIRRLQEGMDNAADPDDPEVKLAFLFADENPENRLRILKRSLWEVTHEGYCRAMQSSLDAGIYDPDAQMWQVLYPLKEDIQALYEKYEKICQK